MGCEPSFEKNHSQLTASQAGHQDFRISYREFVKNDVGEVFEFYHFSKIINRSSTSLIRRVIHRVSKAQRICKIVPIQKKQKIHAIKQVENLKNLDHPNIVQIQQYFFDKTYLYIIMELIHGDKLTQFLVNHSNCSLDSLIRIIQQLLIACNYCHKKNLAHNMIHPENIMIITKGKEFFVKLVDFSEASVIGSPKISRIEFPNQFKIFKDPKSGSNVSEKSDVWSLGMTFYFMLSGQKNFKEFLTNKKEFLKQKIECFDIQQSTASLLLDVLMKMLDQQPEKRPSLQELLKHEIFKQFREQRPQSNHRKKEDHFLSRLMRFKKCQYMTQFCNLDKNKDGKLDKNQIRQGLVNTFNLTQEDADSYVQKIFKSIDKNNNENLEYSQFVMATSMISKHISEERLEKIFKEMDINHDGYITAEELSSMTGGIEGATGLLKNKKKISLGQFKDCMMEIFEKSKDPSA